MKRSEIFTFLFLLVIIFLPLVNAVPPPFEATSNIECEILNPYYEYLPQNQEFDFLWHVYNTTALITNNTAECAFHLYSKQQHGEHIFVNNSVTSYVFERDFEQTVPASNFSMIGEYCYLIECGIPSLGTKTDTNQACGIERCFQITKIGYELTSHKIYLYILLFLTFFIFLSISIYTIFKVESQAFVIFNICVIYLLIFLIFFISWLLSYNYNNNLPVITNILYFIWLILSISFLPFIIILFVYLYKEAIKELNNNIQTKRGLKNVL